MMKTTNLLKTLRALGMAAGLFSGASNLMAQNDPPPGNFDPAQMRQRMVERIREAMDVKDDSEWNAISERLGQVLEARRAARESGAPGGFGRPGGPPPRGNRPPRSESAQAGEAGPDQPDAAPAASPRGEFRGPPRGPGGPGGFNAELSPEAQALRKAIAAKAPAAELKTRLTEFKAARLKKQADLEKAQDELRQILTVQQEAVAVSFGLL